MARAYNIHIVQDPEECNEVVAAFTVKHELESWLAKQPDDKPYFVTKVRDGARA